MSNLGFKTKFFRQPCQNPTLTPSYTNPTSPVELSVPVQVPRRVDGDGGRCGVEEQRGRPHAPLRLHQLHRLPRRLRLPARRPPLHPGATAHRVAGRRILSQVSFSNQGCQMAKFDPFLSLDCARVEGVGAQSKERKGSNFAA